MRSKVAPEKSGEKRLSARKHSVEKRPRSKSRPGNVTFSPVVRAEENRAGKSVVAILVPGALGVLVIRPSQKTLVFGDNQIDENMHCSEEAHEKQTKFAVP